MCNTQGESVGLTTPPSRLRLEDLKKIIKGKDAADLDKPDDEVPLVDAMKSEDGRGQFAGLAKDEAPASAPPGGGPPGESQV